MIMHNVYNMNIGNNKVAGREEETVQTPNNATGLHCMFSQVGKLNIPLQTKAKF